MDVKKHLAHSLAQTAHLINVCWEDEWGAMC